MNHDSRENAGRAGSGARMVHADRAYGDLFEHASVALYLADAEGRIQHANAAMARLLGRADPESLIGVSLADAFVEPAVRDRWRAAEGAEEIFEARIRRRNGEPLWAEVHARSVRDADGRLIRRDGCLVDITERRLASDALRRNEEVFRDAFERGLVGVAILSPQRRWLEANQRLGEILGYDREELKGKACVELTFPADMDADTELFEKVLAGKLDRYAMEKRFVRKDGRPVWTRFMVAGVRDAAGKVDHVIVHVIDISALKKAEQAMRQSEQRLDSLAESTTDWVWEVDAEGRYTWASARVKDLLGYEVGEVLGRTPFGRMPPEEAQRVSALFHEIAGRAEPLVRVVNVNLHKDGRRVVLETSGVPFFGADGALLGYRGIDRDITERVEAAEALRQSESTLKSVLQAAPAGIGLVRDRIIMWTNEQVRRMLGYAEEELVGHGAEMVYETREEFERVGREKYAQIAETGFGRVETSWRCKDGRVIDILLSSSSVESGAAAGETVFTALDITARKAAERALQESERRYRRLIDTMQEGLALVDADFVLTFSNDRFARMLGYEPADLLGRDMVGLVDEAFRDKFAEQIARRRRGQSSRYECVWRARDGRVVYAINSAMPMIDEDGCFAGSVAVVTDISDRKQMEDALRASEEKYRTLVTNLPQRVFYKNSDLVYVSCNENFARDGGLEASEVSGKTDFDFFPPDLAEAYRADDRRILETGAAEEYEEDYGRGGQIRVRTIKTPVRDEAGEIIGILGIFWDITELLRAEEEKARLAEQLRHAQKMEAIGRLAGGVAHDFNNQLTVIRGYCDMLLLSLQPGGAAEAGLKEIQKAAERSAELTGKLLAFGRKQMLRVERVRPAELVAGLHDALSRLLGEDVRLSIDVDAAVGVVEIDRSQFEQALINLAINARDAMPEGGELALSVADVDLSVGDTRLPPDVAPGPFAVLRVRDTGVGMDEQTVRQVFEPFFTTKESGKGTGLGLSMVYGFVKQSGGFISVDSAVGEGTTFAVHLPRVEGGAAPAEAAEAEAEAESAAPRRGGETILVAEDEETVRRFIVRMLGHRGYTILAAADAEEALAAAEAHEGDIDLLITDVVMPGMRGPQLAEAIQARRPSMAVLYISGYAEEAAGRRGLDLEHAAFLAKPFGFEMLEKKVRGVLDEAASKR